VSAATPVKAGASRFSSRNSRALRWSLAAGLAAMVAIGLVLFGRDGKMLTYVAMVGLSATAQWVMLKGWRG